MAALRTPPAVARVLERVVATARRPRMFAPGACVVVAVSGGGIASGAEGAVGSGAVSENKSVTLASVIEALRSPKYREREDATLALMRLPAERRSDIEQALARETDLEAAVETVEKACGGWAPLTVLRYERVPFSPGTLAARLATFRADHAAPS